VSDSIFDSDKLNGRININIVSSPLLYPAPNRRGIKRCVCLTSVWHLSVCLSVAYIGPKSRTERPRKIKIGIEVTHVTRTRTPLSRSKGQRSRSPGRFTHRRVGASGSCSGGRGNVLAVRNCCYVAVCSATRDTSAPTGGERGGGISWRPPAYSLFQEQSIQKRLTFYGTRVP